MKSENVTAADLAKVLGIAKPRVAALATDGILPRVGRGEFNLAQCVQAFVRYKVSTAGDDNVASLTAERSRLARLKADQVEREAMVEAGELIPADRIEKAWLGVATAVRSRLLLIPSKIASRVVGKAPAEVQELVRRELHAALDEIAATPVA